MTRGASLPRQGAGVGVRGAGHAEQVGAYTARAVARMMCGTIGVNK